MEPIDLAALKAHTIGFKSVLTPHVLALIAAIEQKDAALRAVLVEPFGCPFCDSGKLRPGCAEHATDCAFQLVPAALALTKPE